MLYFEPHGNFMEENKNGAIIKEFMDDNETTLDCFKCCIDYHDIVSIQKIRGFNKHANENENQQKYFMFDFYMQINVSKINNNSLEKLVSDNIL